MEEGNKKVKLGIFVLAGTIFLILALYYIGSKRNLFGDTFKINAEFYNVNGLMKGNNVRFSGIDVGTVEMIEIISDSSVRVTMTIEKSIRKFIKKNAVASVGTDGLMGNKLVNINTVAGFSQSVEEGDELQTLRPIEMDEMVRTLNSTNENMKVITSNLRNITDKINSKNSLWNILMDTVVAENVKGAVVNIKRMGEQGVIITGKLKSITEGVQSGKGSLGALITDTILSSRLTQTVIKFEKLSDTAVVLGGDVTGIIKQLKQGKGTMGVLLKDTNLVHDLNKSINSIDKGANSFNENMEALRHTWPFKKYFRNKKK